MLKETVKCTAVLSFLSFVTERICGAVDCLVSDVIID